MTTIYCGSGSIFFFEQKCLNPEQRSIIDLLPDNQKEDSLLQVADLCRKMTYKQCIKFHQKLYKIPQNERLSLIRLTHAAAYEDGSGQDILHYFEKLTQLMPEERNELFIP
jgi:hypothetical protein